jgi:hypothetical protein
MTKWEYKMIAEYIISKGFLGRADFRSIWNNKDDKGKSAFDNIKEFGEEGWELVSVTSMFGENNNSIAQVLFTFKRPLQE